MTFGGFVATVFGLLIAMAIFGYIDECITKWMNRKTAKEETQEKNE